MEKVVLVPPCPSLCSGLFRSICSAAKGAGQLGPELGEGTRPQEALAALSELRVPSSGTSVAPSGKHILWFSGLVRPPPLHPPYLHCAQGREPSSSFHPSHCPQLPPCEMVSTGCERESSLIQLIHRNRERFALGAKVCLLGGTLSDHGGWDLGVFYSESLFRAW